MPKTDATIRVTVDAFLSSSRCANRNTRRTYGDVLDRLAGHLGADRRLADVFDDELVDALHGLWGKAAASTWNSRRAAVGSWLA